MQVEKTRNCRIRPIQQRNLRHSEGPADFRKDFDGPGRGFHLVHQLQPVAALPGHTPFDDLRAVLRCKVKTAVLRLPKGWRQKWLKSGETMWLATRASLLGAVV